MLHTLLQRQLRRCGMSVAEMPSDVATWGRFLESVSRAYVQHDQDRELMERSLALSGEEMRGLYERVSEHASELERRVKERTGELARACEAAKAASLAKDQFLANISHEVRTPLTAIIGFTELLRDPSFPLEEREQALATVQQQCDRLLALVNDILDFSKIESGMMRVERIAVNPLEVIEEVLSTLRVAASEKGIELRGEYHWPLPAVLRSDPLRMRQVLLNLVGNAVKFTERGSVLLRASLDEPAQRLHIEVRDTGIGMDESQLAKLFQRFSQADESMTRRYGGAGLGLAISHELTRLMGGELRAISAPGKGSTFTFSLNTGPLAGVPMLRGTCTAVASGAKVSAGPPTNMRILLVDDAPENRQVIGLHLRRAGASVSIAEDGRSAIEEALAGVASGRPFDVILMDMQMPNLDGYAATSRLREQGYKGPIIALTAHAMSTDRERCLRVGCDEYVAKPVDFAALLEACRRWTAQRAGWAA